MARESKRERHIWELLIGNIEWAPPANGSVKVRTSRKAKTPPKFQIYEVIVAMIFARLCPRYEWFITPAGPDEGIDFVGEGQLFEDSTLDVAMAIRVGGQCKKGTEVKDVLKAFGSSLFRMAKSLNPTFFVVALSARVTKKQVREAQDLIENEFRRHCHILDRSQIEGLIYGHLPLVSDILLEAGFEDHQLQDIVEYFQSKGSKSILNSLEISELSTVRAGEPFRITVRTHAPLTSALDMRVAWRLTATEREPEPITLLDPIAAEEAKGVEFSPDTGSDYPLGAKVTLELVSHSVGLVDLGEIIVGPEDDFDSARRIPLGQIEVAENRQPRFFAPPLRQQLSHLEAEYRRARAGGSIPVGIIGAGGSGKSRLCEEFAQRERRRGSAVVSARPAQVLDDPYPLLVEMFSGLAGEGFSHLDPAANVIEAVARYDPATANKAEPAIRAVFGLSRRGSSEVIDQSIVAALVVLIVARSSRAPLILHLKDLHWCSFELLELLRQLIWQLNQESSAAAPFQKPGEGVLMLLEGRVRSRSGPSEEGWTTELFEAFLRKLNCDTIACSAFKPEDGRDFVQFLFEDHRKGSRISAELVGEQNRLVEEVFRSAGGNPFHTLEQVRILQHSGIIGQNQRTGLLYLIRPETGPLELPPKVAESIEVRWRYLRTRTPELALLIWAAGLLEDRIPMPLFRRLWQEVAPEVSLGEVDATDILWTGEGKEREASFRHEHYFSSINHFDVPAEERERVVTVYSEWLAGKRAPADRFRRARALLEFPKRNTVGAQRLMRSALRSAKEQGNLLLARRIAAASLDVAWEEDERKPLETRVFLRRCDEELGLVRELIGSDRLQADKRLNALSARMGERLGRRWSPKARVELQRRELIAQVLESQILFNARKPVRGAEVVAKAIEGIRVLRGAAPVVNEGREWEALEVEALHSQSAALALSGEIDEAIRISEQAVEIVREPSHPLAHRVVSTYANIYLARDPAVSERILRKCMRKLSNAPEERDSTEVNLAMALVLQAYARNPGDKGRCSELAEARSLLGGVSSRAIQVGDYPISGAAALMLGIVCALEDEVEEAVSRFRQAVAATARGSQLEALWRAHIDLACALHRAGEPVDGKVHDHARAALTIMEETLTPYAQPDRSARFDLIRIPLAHAVRFLIAADDKSGIGTLERHPGLRSCFEDTGAGILRADRGGFRSHEWLRIGDEDYVIY